MSTEIKTWQIVNGNLVEINSSMIAEKKKEKEHLEKWIKTNPEILGNDIFIIGEQVKTKSGPLDFLGIDTDGNIVVIELKRDRGSREALAQAMDYASDVATWDAEKIGDICFEYNKQSLDDFLSAKMPEKPIEDISLNQGIRLLLVCFSVEESLERMISWLSDVYNFSINAIILKYIKTQGGDELLSRTVIIPDEIEKEKANRKKIEIAKSDEPGHYSDKELKEKLKGYFSSKIVSSERIRHYLLPILLKKKMITRSDLKKEFVNEGAASDESQAGYFLSLISSQLGYKRNDCLRQIIHYEYPNNFWEKDNFSLNEQYRTLVKEVIENKE